MLARVANSLYWIGRNMERSEYCTRYLQVQYFSTLDAPMTQNRDFAMRSIMYMLGSELDLETNITERDIWNKVLFNINNPNSLFYIAKLTRENARSIRNSISTELWEAINKWHLYNNKINKTSFSSSQLFNFCEETITNITLSKAAAAKTMLRNDSWIFLYLGIYLERALQVLRILKSKIADSNILSNNGKNIPLLQYQWTTLLKTLEAFDVYKSYNRGKMIKSEICKFILENELFPRALCNTTEKILFHFNSISIKPENHNLIYNSFKLQVDEFNRFSDFEDDDKVDNLIDDAYNSFLNFHIQIQKVYFD